MRLVRTVLILSTLLATSAAPVEPSAEPTLETEAATAAAFTDSEESTVNIKPFPPASTLIRYDGPVTLPTSAVSVPGADDGPALITNTASILDVPGATFGPGKIVTLSSTLSEPLAGPNGEATPTATSPDTSVSLTTATATDAAPTILTAGSSGATLVLPSVLPTSIPTDSLVMADSPPTSTASDYNATNLPFKINAPGGAEQWWVLGATNYLFATPPSDHNLRVGLTNADTNMLSAYGGWWDLGGFDCKTDQEPPVCIIAIKDLGQATPGAGYTLYLTRADDPLSILGVSETFNIEPAGSPQSGKFSITIKNNSASPSSSPSQWSAMGESGVSVDSAGWRDSPALRLVVACVAVVLLAVI